MLLPTSTGSYDGDIFHNHGDSNTGHYTTALATFEGSPFAVGGYEPTSNKTETYNITTDVWTDTADYPYHN